MWAIYFAVFAIAAPTMATDSADAELHRQRREAGRAPNWRQLNLAAVPSGELRDELVHVGSTTARVSAVLCDSRPSPFISLIATSLRDSFDRFHHAESPLKRCPFSDGSDGGSGSGGRVGRGHLFPCRHCDSERTALLTSHAPTIQPAGECAPRAERLGRGACVGR